MPQRMIRIEEPPPPPPAKEPLLTLGMVKSVFDASWKLLPILWFAFNFYTNQTAIAKDTASNQKEIKKLQTEYNQLVREVTETSASLKALKEIQDHDREFYLLTAPPPGRRR